MNTLVAITCAGLLALPLLAEDERAEWVREHAIAFDTVEAGPGFEDLAGLKAMIGDARIVALGEGTHGTREFFQMKHRLTEFLAIEMGFTIFSIEANMPESYRINDWVLGADGDPAALIAGMYFWTWRTEEVLAMVSWMRDFNTAGNERLQFTGFDMQTADVAMQIVQDFIAGADPGRLAEITKTYAHARTAHMDRGGGAFGVATGSFPIDVALGKTVRFSGDIKTAGLKDGYAGLWWRVDALDGKVLAFDNMQNRGPRGDTGWQRYEIELEVPKNAVNINFGALMPGDGIAWFDNLKIELDGKTYEDPILFDFDFEGANVRGLHGYSPRYFVGLDAGEATSGRQSLRIMRLPDRPHEPAGADPAEARRECRAILQSLEAARDRYAAQAGGQATAWAIQNARVVVQAMRMRAGGGGLSRDEDMAANVAWILEQNRGAKIVLWAHNGHIGRRRGAMGRHLNDMFGDDYLPVGFATSDGEYVAVGNGGLGAHDLQRPPDGSVEAILHDTGLPRLLVDVRTAEPGSGGSGWLCKPRPFRMIGAMAMDDQFGQADMQDLFDLLIYVDETSAAVQLP